MWEPGIGKAASVLLKGVPRWVLVSVAIASAVFLFAPRWLRDSLWLPEPDKYTGPTAGVTLLLSLPALVFIAIEPVLLEAGGAISRRWKQRALEKTRAENEAKSRATALRDLPSDALAFLLRVREQGQVRFTLDGFRYSRTNAIVKALAFNPAVKLLGDVGTGPLSEMYEFEIQPWACEELDLILVQLDGQDGDG